MNGTIVTELGSKADLDRDHIKVDGKLLHAPKRLVYIALNKPEGVRHHAWPTRRAATPSWIC